MRSGYLTQLSRLSMRNRKFLSWNSWRFLSSRALPSNYSALHQEDKSMALSCRSFATRSVGEKGPTGLAGHSTNEELTFSTAAKLLFAPARNPDKFGWDFHLWQFFVACLPPTAVYLVAQYARYDMKITEKRFEEISKARLEAKEQEGQTGTDKDGISKEAVAHAAERVQETQLAAAVVEGPNGVDVPNAKVAGTEERMRTTEEELRWMRTRLEKLERELGKSSLPSNDDRVIGGAAVGGEQDRNAAKARPDVGTKGGVPEQSDLSDKDTVSVKPKAVGQSG